ncbi:MAG TPA: hypothetical protein GXZ65_02410 [Clostridiales bacterium]|jgi:hypothetical protein|nr:hypothetical protein [Clostridiales bacterium]
MKVYEYLVSEIYFKVLSESDELAGESKFRLNSAPPNSGGVMLKLKCRGGGALPQGAELIAILHQNYGEGYRILFVDREQNIVHQIEASRDLKRFETSVPENQRHAFENNIGEVAFRTAILSYGGVVVHSAGVDCEGSGILFCGPSGMGKSTQAGLWKQHKNARILNADRTALRVIDGSVYVFGTPWSGSSKENLNSKAALKGIFFLQQAKENSLSLLKPSEAVKFMLPRCFLPFGCEELMDLALDNIEQILGKVPSFLLRCLPDYEAVEMVSNCLGVQDPV